jgi:hypothetical protein
MNLGQLMGVIPQFENVNNTPLKGAKDFGERFLMSKYSRPYRHKNRKALANWRSGNKKKLRQFAK